MKWIKASIEVSNSKDESAYRKFKGVWKAFWLAPKLDKTSSVEEFKKTHKE